MRPTFLAVAGSLALLLAACGGSSEKSSEQTANTAPLPEDDPAAPASGTSEEEAASAPAGGGAAAEPAGDVELSAEEREALDRMIELMTSFTDDLIAAGEDCDKIAATLNGFVDGNQEELEQLGQTLENAEAGKQQKMTTEMQQAIGPKMQEAFGGMMACQDHEGVQQGLEKMQTLQ